MYLNWVGLCKSAGKYKRVCLSRATVTRSYSGINPQGYATVRIQERVNKWLAEEKAELARAKKSEGEITISYGDSKLQIPKNTYSAHDLGLLDFEPKKSTQLRQKLAEEKGIASHIDREYTFNREKSIVALLDNKPIDLSEKLETGGTLKFLTNEEVDRRYNQIHWYSSSFALGVALEYRFGDRAISIDYQNLLKNVEDYGENELSREGRGFYFDYGLIKKEKMEKYSEIVLDKQKSALDKVLELSKIHNEIFEFLRQKDIDKLWEDFAVLALKKREIKSLKVDKEKALEIMNFNPFRQLKIEKMFQEHEQNIAGVGSGSGSGSGVMQAGIRLYKCENTVDVLESPLVQNMGQLGYEHGLKYGSCHYYVDRKRDNEKMTVETTTKDPIFNRIYGVSFSTKELRKNYVAYLASLAKINHRAISRTQDLFLVHKTSPGSPIFLPAGTRLFNRLVQLMRSKYEEYEFQEIITPLMFNKELWETSGHWENYKNDMYAVVDANPNDTAGPAVPEVGLKPMNCPSHCLVYKSAPKSANDLPLRYADFTALHRNEPSGTLVGLTRVRKFHQDDGHIFCSFDDIGKEISKQLQMIAEVYSILRFDNYSLSLSTRPEKYIGTSDTWDRAESLLKTALDTSGIAYDIKHGDGAFYGPKIDIDVRDAYGRRHQTATIQLDFQLPERFNLYYSNADGSAKSRPVIIHRAVLGSLERMMALLIEYYEGRWPFWISPRQAIVIPTIDDSTSVKDKGIILEYADTVKRLLSGGSNSVKYLDRLYPATNTGVNSNVSSQPNQNNPDTTSIRMKNYSFHVDFEKNYHQPTYKIKNRAKELNYNYHITVGLDNAQNKTINVKNYIDNKNLGTIQIKDLQQEFMNKMDHYK